MPPSERTLGPFGWKVSSGGSGDGDGNDDTAGDEDVPDDPDDRDEPSSGADRDEPPSGTDDGSRDKNGTDDGSGDKNGTEDEPNSPGDGGPLPGSGDEGDDRMIAERTLGPMNWRIPFGGDAAPDDERTTRYGEAADYGGFEFGPHPTETGRERRVVHEGWTIDRLRKSVGVTAILGGVGMILLIDTMSMMIPILAAIGGGLVGGFVAGYLAGGVVRGALHGFVAGVVGGVAAGFLTAMIGVTLGLFMEPATLLGDRVGIVSPWFSGMGLLEPLLLTAILAGMIALDATIGGGVGGGLRSLVDDAR